MNLFLLGLLAGLILDPMLLVASGALRPTQGGKELLRRAVWGAVAVAVVSAVGFLTS
jgi:hypothetical protein